MLLRQVPPSSSKHMAIVMITKIHQRLDSLIFSNGTLSCFDPQGSITVDSLLTARWDSIVSLAEREGFLEELSLYQ